MAYQPENTWHLLGCDHFILFLCCQGSHTPQGLFSDFPGQFPQVKRDQNKALFETRTKVISYYNTAISSEWESARFTEAPKRQKSKELQFLLIIFFSVTHVYIPLSSRLDFYISGITRTYTKPVFMPLSIKYIWRCNPGLKNDRKDWLKRLTNTNTVQDNRLMVSAHRLTANKLSWRECFKH